ncbi:MAG: response regulator, partial [Limisphaerales bacterium]
MNAKPTVLLAEDEPADVFMLQRTVRKIGAPVDLQVVRNGEELADYLLAHGQFTDRDLFPTPKLILL